MDPIESVRRRGGVACLAELRMDGARENARIVALREGSLHRVRNGWFALPSADQQLVRAVRVGGRITCVSALASHGLWMMPDDRLHVAVPENAARLRSPANRKVRLDPLDPTVVVHWGQFDWAPPRNAAHDTVAAAIGHLVLCQTRENAIVAIDSALNKKLVSLHEVRSILRLTPGDHSLIASRVDGRAQSGLETIARLRFRSRRVRVRIQVDIAGLGRVDCLIGDRLILELDSREHHVGANYEKDRTRDLIAVDQGYIVLRVSYRRVMYKWTSIESVVLNLVRRGDHEWSALHRRLRVAP